VTVPQLAIERNRSKISICTDLCTSENHRN